MAQPELGRIRDDIEPFESELMEEFYQNFAGLKDDMATVPIFDKYAHLFSKDSIDEIRKFSEGLEEAEDKRWVTYLRAFSTFGYMDNEVKALTDMANTFEAQSVVELDGQRIPYRAVPVMLRNEADAEKRRKLFEEKLVETRRLNSILLERMSLAHDSASALGFKNYRDMCSALKGTDYKALEEQMESMLRRTEGLYLSSMDELMVKRAGIPLAEAWSYDIPYAFRGQDFDGIFPKEGLVEALFKTLKGLGLQPERFDNIHIDMDDRPKKSPRAFCAPVRVPDDIRLVIKPAGGWRDYEAFMHEAGHSWHYGSTKRKHAAEYRYLGDRSVTESYAFLFEYLATSRTWLHDVMGMEDPDEFIEFHLTNKLMFLRRYAAKLVYELKLHNAKLSPEFREIYRSCLQKSLRFRHTEEHYLEDVDDHFYCAEYLRAWILEGQIRAALEGQFGEDWYAKKKAGDFLIELWSYGQKYTAEELVKTIGYVDLDMDPMLREIEQGLSRSG